MVFRNLKILVAIVLALALAAVSYIAVAGKDLLRIATGSVSHSLCMTTFVSGLDPDLMYVEEQLPMMRSIGWTLHYDVDRVRREVRTTIAGAFVARAVFREGLGCLLVRGGPVPEAAGLKMAVVAGAFPQSRTVEPTDVALRKVVDSAFTEPDPAHRRLTKAVVVLHDGKLVAERYAAGYGPDTPVHGHSLSKSVTSAVIGILVRQGKLQREQAAPVAAWQASSDARSQVTIDQLLRMSSGLPFDETNGPVNPMTRMLFLEPDMATYATQMPLVHAPGTAWNYSNLGYLVLSRLIRDAAGSRAIDAERFVHHELFDPLGMRTATIECDATGTPVGASNVYASPRDWARFGQLYLDDGVLDGRRILPEEWVSYSTSQTLDTGYGAGFWTNLVTHGRVPVWDAPWGMPELPKDMFYARGALGQYIVIVPSERLVVARFGISHEGGTGIGSMVADIIAALHRHQPLVTARGGLGDVLSHR